MAENLFTGNNGFFAAEAADGVDLDTVFNTDNCLVIQRIGNPITTWKPDRLINAFTTFEADKCYLGKLTDNIDASTLTIPPYPSTTGYEAEATAYFARAAAAGSPYTFTTTEKTGFNNLILAGKSHGWLAKMVAWYIYWGNVAVAKFNVLSTSYTQTWFGDLDFAARFSVHGTTTGYAKTGIIPSTHLALNNYGYFGYLNSNINGSFQDMGADDGTRAIYFIPRAAGATIISAQSGATSPTVSGGTTTDSSGLWFIERMNVALINVYRGNIGTPGTTLVGTSTVTEALGMPTVEMYLFANNNNGSPGGISANPHNTEGFTSGMTKAECDYFNDDYQTFLTAVA